MLDKEKAIKICKQIGNIFEKNKLTNEEVLKILELYMKSILDYCLN